MIPGLDSKTSTRPWEYILYSILASKVQFTKHEVCYYIGVLSKDRNEVTAFKVLFEYFFFSFRLPPQSQNHTWISFLCMNFTQNIILTVMVDGTVYFKASIGFWWTSCPTCGELRVLHIFGFASQFLAYVTLVAYQD